MSDPIVVMHRPPLKRIDFNPVRKRPEDVTEMDFSYSPAECARIWGLIRQSAEGCTCPTSPPQSTDLPSDCADTVFTGG